MIKVDGTSVASKKSVKSKQPAPKSGLRSYWVYTDGSVRKGRFGAWCAIIVDEEGKETILSKAVFDTTIGKMELAPILAALEFLSQPSILYVHSDSQYAVNSVSKWLRLWFKANWKNLRGETVKNVEILQKIYPLLSKHDVRIKWVKGHSGHIENEKADSVARTITLRMKKGKIKPDT